MTQTIYNLADSFFILKHPNSATMKFK